MNTRIPLLIVATLALLLTATPGVAAAPSKDCIETPLPDEVAPCVPPQQVCLATLPGCFNPTDPDDIIRYIKDQFGPCTCPPPPKYW